jgi:hypothetical protein
MGRKAVKHHFRGRITSGGASSQGEKRNILFVIVVKGGEIKSKTKSTQRTENT